MDTEKQKQCRHDDTRLTKSGSEQLLMMPTESLAHIEWLPGELLSGSDCRSPGWFLDIKYQTCLYYRVVTLVASLQKTSQELDG